MKTIQKIITSLVLFLSLTSLTSCRKEIAIYADEDVSEIVSKVSSWLDKQKQAPNSSSIKIVSSNSTETKLASAKSTSNSIIDMFKDNLEYNQRLQSDINKKHNYIIIPIKDDVKSKKNIESFSSLCLILITDKTGKIISGTIACYLPKDGKPKGYNGVRTVADIFKGKGPADSGMVQFMDVTGRFLHEIGFKKGKVSSYAEIKRKANNQLISSQSECTNWYLITTYYDQYGAVISESSRYIGTTCIGDGGDCTGSELRRLCPGEGGGGGGGDESQNNQWEESINSSSSESGFLTDDSPSGPAGAGIIEPPVEINHFARKKMQSILGADVCYDVVISPAQIMNPSIVIVRSNGTTVWREACLIAQSTHWHHLTPVSVWIEWNGTLKVDYIWYGGANWQTRPHRHVRIA